ncbi:MAG TPA: hypothetical protein PL155_01835 [Candidatus Omnitrophota bacterium]|nr:hypothetical protein [Candidatus Omnitrophota bacterium]HPD84772.1 hypothetical protein [Candidatus Omnitrophota bacterium]HRZ03630.1 hypothetical protein [Candidatus Omnitrophota bacterium]
MIKKSLLVLGFFWFLGLGQPQAWGSLSFEGNVDFVKKQFDLKLFLKDGGTIQTQAVSMPNKGFRFDTQLDHVKVAKLDVVTRFKSAVEFVSGAAIESFLRGEISSQYSLLNYKPVGELSGYFEVKKGRLYLSSVSWGGVICDGYVGLLPPHDIDLAIRFSEIDLTDLFVLLGWQTDEKILGGEISGRIKLSGFLDKLMLRGSLMASNGFIREMQYDDIVANFEGMYPIIHIAESNMAESSGLVFNMEGDINLASAANFMRDIGTLTMSPLVGEGDRYRDWTIKSKRGQGKSTTTAFKYRLQKRIDEESRPEDGSDMLGFENRIKF